MKTLTPIRKKEKSLIEGRFIVRGYPEGSVVFKEVNGKKVIDKEAMLHVKPSSVIEVENQVVSSTGYGVNMLARWQGGETTYPVVIDSAGIGTGTTAPTSADTGMEAEVLGGIAIQTATVVSNVLTLDIFIANASLANNTYTEFGLKMNSRLFSRASMSYVKGSNQDTTIEYVITYNV